MQQLEIDNATLAKLAKAARDRAHDSVEDFFRHPDCRKGEWSNELRARAGIMLSLVGAAFGIKSEQMRGEGEHGDGFDTARAYVVAAAGDKTRAPELTPSQFAEGVRRVFRECRTFPSYGLLRDLAHGRDVTGYPGGMLKGQEDPTQPEIHPRWADLAKRWARENRAMDAGHRGITTREVGIARAREFQKLMGETFTVGDWPAE